MTGTAAQGTSPQGGAMLTVFLVTRAHGLPLCRAIAERLGVPETERVLVTADTGDEYELRPTFPVEQRDGSGFATVLDWNALIWPARAHGWTCEPGGAEARLLRRFLSGGEEVPLRLVVESLQVPPAAALVQALPDAEVHVYSDGLMTYGGRRLPAVTAGRVVALHYRDLLPALRPRLLDHRRDLRYEPYAVAEMEPATAAPALPGRTAVVLQQYLAGLGLLTAEEERTLTRRMVAAALEDGAERVLLKAHPAGGRGEASVDVGEDATVRPWTGRGSLEAWLAALDPSATTRVSVYSCFSTGLVSARRFGVRAVAVGTDLLLERLAPGNGNYVPAVICDSVCETVPHSGGLAAQPPRADEQWLDLVLELLAYLNDPYAHWRTRQDLAERCFAAPMDVRDYLHRYVRRSKLRSHGLFSRAEEPSPTGREAEPDDGADAVSPVASGIRSASMPANWVPEPDTRSPAEERHLGGVARASCLVAPQTLVPSEPGAIGRAAGRAQPAVASVLSVVVSIRNVQASAGSLEDSIAGNAGAGIEWLLVGGAESEGLRAGIAGRQPGVRLVRREGEVGAPGVSCVPADRNAGIRAATGTHVTFLDVGDWLAPGYLARIRDEAVAAGTDVLRVSHLEVDGSQTRLVPQPVPVVGASVPARDLILPADQTTPVDLPHAWLNVCSREFLVANGLLFQETLGTAAEREWTWRLFLAAGTVVASGTVGYQRSRASVGDGREQGYLTALGKVAEQVSSGPARAFLPKVHRTLITLACRELEASAGVEPTARRRVVREFREALRAIAEPDLVLATMRLPKSQRLVVDQVLDGRPARTALATLFAGRPGRS